MDLLLPSSIFSPITILLCSLLLLPIVWIHKTMQKNTPNAPPQAKGVWPILGHLHLLRGPQPPHIILAKMADKYGPIFTIKLGVHQNLVVSSWEVAKECFTTKDKAFADRPKVLAMEIMGYNYTMFGFSPYGAYWRQVRKMATLHILSNHKLELLKHVRETEVRVCGKHIFDMWEQNKGGGLNKIKVEMKKWFGDLTLKLMLRLVVGKLSHDLGHEDEDVERIRKQLRGFFRLAGEFVISDAIPCLRWLDLGGYEKAMKKIAEELDVVMQKCLDEHKLRKKSKSLHQGNVENDFMDMLLSVVEDDGVEQFGGSISADTIIKSTCLAILLAGTDTTAVTLTWALALLVNNPEVMKKAQIELDNYVGRERQVHEADLKNLVYLQAILKETLRLYPAGPLLVPHEAREDCTISNYHVSSGTRLLVNLLKIQRDPNVWLEPNEFKPERFLTTHKDVDVRGQSFELTPFGTGRRMCPGISLGLQVTQFTLANLLHGFDITAPSEGPVDMSESSGLTNVKNTPLEVLFTPRLHPKLYENVD